MGGMTALEHGGQGARDDAPRVLGPLLFRLVSADDLAQPPARYSLARFLHERSGRTGSLVSVNCGGLPETMFEDELFGHVRGAFSGAQAERQGLPRGRRRHAPSR